MSSPSPFNENLSACFDHEVSPEERLELESQLEQSRAARQELHEFGELSRLLQETATESAPPELAPSIRRRIEQETLLTSTETVPARHVPSMLRYRIAVAISACSSVAALVLFVLLLNIDTPESSRQLSQADHMILHSEAEPFITTSGDRNDNRVAARSNQSSYQAESDKLKAVPMAAPAPSVELQVAERNLKEERLGVKENLTMKSAAGKSPADFSVHNTLAEQNSGAKQFKLTEQGRTASPGIPSHIPLDSIRIGDVLPYFRDIDGKVAVIEVRVVDVKQALGTMELLLARNNIPVDQQKQSEVERQLNRKTSLAYSNSETNPQAGPGKAETDQQLFAVYVEATDAQLASTLEEFQQGLKRDQMLSLALQPAITEQSLKEEAASLPQLLAQQTAPLKQRQAGKSTSWGLQTELKKSDPSIKNPEDSQPSTEGLAQAKPQASSAQRSYQMRYRMQVPAEKVASLQDIPQRTLIQQEDQEHPAADDAPLVASKPTHNQIAKSRMLAQQSADALISEAPVKVLFVFKTPEHPAAATAPQ